MLTIAIPTYDRNAKLLATVERLLPQLTEQCRLIVLDNHSPTPVEETLRDTLARFPQVESRVVRHPYNLGGPANFMRCFEWCETDYLWILGDDDPPTPGAIGIIFEHFARHPDAVFFNFSAAALPLHRTSDVTTRGLDELIDGINHFGQLIWLSVCVYKCVPLRGELRFGSAYVQGTCPQFLPVLRAAQNGAECFLSAADIVEYDPPPPGQSYSLIATALSATMILDLPWPMSARRRLVHKINEGFNFTARTIARELLTLAVRNHDSDNPLYWFDQIMARLFYFETGLRPALERKLLRLLLRFPSLTQRALGLWRLILRRPTPGSGPTDILSRG